MAHLTHHLPPTALAVSLVAVVALGSGLVRGARRTLASAPFSTPL